MAVASLTGIISSFSSLAIPITWLIVRPVHATATFRLLLLYALCTFIGDRIPDIIGSSATTTRVLSFVVTIIEYTIFTLLYYRFFHRKGNKRWVIIGSVIFLTTVVLELDKFGFLYYSRFNAGTAAMLIISYTFLLFHEWLMDDPMEMIYNKVEFWIALGCLVYLSGSFFFYLTVGKKWEENWVLHSVCNLVKHLFFSIAIVQAAPRTATKKTFEG